MNKSEPNVHRIGEISAATGMTIRTLHYYEEIGLIPYREYSAVDPETLLAPWPPVRLGRHLPRSPSPRVSSTLRTRTTDVDRSSRPINPMLLCLVKVQFGVLEESPDASCDESFEASGGFSFGLAFAGSSGHIVLGDWAAALASDRNEVERPVELAITTSIEPVPVLVLT
jgi:hypothetical protein